MTQPDKKQINPRDILKKNMFFVIHDVNSEDFNGTYMCLNDTVNSMIDIYSITHNTKHSFYIYWFKENKQKWELIG